MMKKFCIFLIFLLFSGSLTAQQTITGTVTASDTKETLPGATVVVKGTTSGAVTGIDGNYTIQVPPGSTLVFSYVGYNTQEITVSDQTRIDVVLEVTKTVLDEVVVIGYGTVRKSDLSGSVGSVKSEDITRITAVNPIQSLQGNVAGVQVSSGSGQPGASPSVRIRGVGTFGNTNPIYVVDGMILDDISYLNAQDILSMEVLKDASATAIYGSRGANGVIMVTTKMGKGEEKVTYNFTAEAGIQQVAHKIPLLTGKEFATVSNIIQPGSFNNVDLVPNTDWQDLIFRTAPQYNLQLSATGAGKSSNYYISGGYFRQEGIIPKSNYERITFQLNNTYNLSEFVKVGNFLTLTPFQSQGIPDVSYLAYRADPTLEPYYPNGAFAAVPGVGNPLAVIEYSNNFNKGIRGVGNIFAEVNFLKDFTLKSSYGIDAGYSDATSFTPAFTIYNPDSTISQQQNLTSDLFRGSSTLFTWLWENTLNFDRDFGLHTVNAVAGYTMQQTRSEAMGITGENIIRNDPNFWYIDPTNITTNTINGIFTNVDAANYYSMISFLVRVNYVFNKRYILTATFRSDGSSKFAEDKRFANFPSVALGWNISQERFLRDVKFLSRLKLRASWGQLGNDKIPYTKRYAVVDQNIVAIFGNPGAINTGASYGVSGNPDLRWEVTSQTDVGLEAGLFNDRLTAEFDYYYKKTNDILIELSTPGYFGNGQGGRVFFNAASMENTGFEFTVSWRDQIGKLKYNIGANGTTVHNEVLEIGGSSGVDSVLIGGFIGNGQSVTRSSVGLPIGAFYGYKTDGIFQNQAELDAYPHRSDAEVGFLRFVDVNGDGVIDDRDRTYLGSPIPTFIFGFNAGIEIFGIDFSVNFQGQTGNKIFNAKEIVRPDKYNFETHVINGWTGEGTSNTEPRPTFGGYNYLPSDKYVYDGSYLRLRSIILGFTLPSAWTTKIRMAKVRLYVKGENVFTSTKYTGYTPEITGDVINTGVDMGVYPVTSVYSVGLNLNF